MRPDRSSTRSSCGCKLRREEIYICNILRCRPPGNRTPLPEECANCREYLVQTLELVQPKVIVCWGGVAAQNLLKTTTSISRLRGKFHSYRETPVLCTFHPSYLLRNPAAEKDVWEDMQMLLKHVGRPIPGLKPKEGRLWAFCYSFSIGTKSISCCTICFIVTGCTSEADLERYSRPSDQWAWSFERENDPGAVQAFHFCFAEHFFVHIEAGTFRRHAVHDERIVGRLLKSGKGLRRVNRDEHAVAAQLEPIAKGILELRIRFDNEHRLGPACRRKVRPPPSISVRA